MKINTETEKQEFLVFEDLYEVARGTVLFLFCICSLPIFLIALVETWRGRPAIRFIIS